MKDVLSRFSPATQDWFRGAFAAPTDAQAGAWTAISHGRHALVVAPTGSGKTLSAFLWAIDSVFRERQAEPPAPPESRGAKRARQETDAARTRVLYISPLKALGVDVERNLRSPLVGIGQSARRLGIAAPAVTVGVRSGDTSSSDRRKLVTDPPDILITTPESLYLMLTSQAAQTLRNVHTVIIDEVHAVAATKRGAHLAVSLERLDALLENPAQRIGLSATVRPIDEVARFLGGAAPVEIVAPRASKAFDLTVVVPVDDMLHPPPPPGEPPPPPGSGGGNDDGSGEGGGDWFTPSGPRPESTEMTGSLWPHVEEAIVDRILQHRSTIVFSNSRRLAERLTARLNEIYSERLGLDLPEPTIPAALMAQAGATAGAEPVLAKAHHGSVSKEQRAIVEDELKSGALRCVVATSSLELGIDMGAVDLVIQVEAPPSAASGLQRIGRAGHQVGETSRAALFPKHRGDVLHTAIVTERMLAGQIEAIRVPQNPLDILAQQTVAAAALGAIEVEDWFETVRRSAPFRTLPRSAYEATLDLLAGRFPSDEFAELRPRLVWDRDQGTLTGRPGAQRIAVTSGGTIPDRGLFGVFVAGESQNARVGELDEEMVYESRVGDVFTLGTTSWRIVEITHDRVNVVPAFGQPGKVPFWHGDGIGRPAELGEALGRFSREVSAAEPAKARERLADAGLDERAQDNLLAYLAEQREATGSVPSDRQLTVERSRDEVGDWRIILHSPFGMQVHAPWALAVNARIRERLGVEGSAVASDDGIIVRIPDATADPPGAELFVFDADELEQIVTDEVGGSALFASRFRECAARALLMPRTNPNRRSPLWQQRQRSAQLLEVARRHPTFPIILETLREVLQDVYDLPALTRIARQIADRRIRLVETTTTQPSPFARDLLFGYVGAFMYEGDSPLAERRAAALSVDPALLSELLGKIEMRELLDPAVIEQFEREAQRLDPDRRVKGIEGVADLLRLLGPLDETEIAARLRAGDEPGGASPDGGTTPDSGVSPNSEMRRDSDAGAISAPNLVASPNLVAFPGPEGSPSPSGSPNLVAARPVAAPTPAESDPATTKFDPTPPEPGPTPPGPDAAVGHRAPATDEPAPDRPPAEPLRTPSAAPTEDRGADAHASGTDPAHAPGPAPRHAPDPAHAPGPDPAHTPGPDPVHAPAPDPARTPAPAHVPGPAPAQAHAHAPAPTHTPASAPTHAPSPAPTHTPGPDPEHARAASPATAAAYAEALVQARRAIRVTIAGTARVAAIEDAGRLRDALGAALPVGIPQAFLEPFPDPFGDLVARYARTHGPFTADAVAARFGVGVAVARHTLQRLEASGRVTSGFFLPETRAPRADETEWCDTEVLRRLRMRSLAAIRGSVEPVPPDAFARFLPTWQHLTRPLEGIDGTLAVIEQLAGVPIPASAWESLVLPSRVRDYAPAMLDELTATGEVLWSGHGSLPGRDGWISLHPADTAALTLPLPDDEVPSESLDARVLEALSAGGAYFAAQVRALSEAENEQSVLEALWRLAWSGRVTNDTFAPVRGLLSGGSQAHRVARRAPRARMFRGTSIPRPTAPARPPAVGGRWSALPAPEADPTLRATASAGLLLDRYGVVTRGSVQNEGVPGGFAQAYRVLSGFEQAGHCRRGYLIEKLGAAQFAASSTIDRLREFSALADPPPLTGVTLAATDPANPYGAALPWPPLEGSRHRPGRKAGALVVLVDGTLVLYLERGGKTALAFTDHEGVLEAAARSLTTTARARALETLTIEQVSGEFVFGTPLGRMLRDAGFVESPRGMTLRRQTAGDAARAARETAGGARA